jgi:hypothetical protein
MIRSSFRTELHRRDGAKGESDSFIQATLRALGTIETIVNRVFAY